WGARALLREFVEFWERLLTDGDFSAGCPVVAAAIGCPSDEPKLSAEAGVILGRWCTALTQAFANDGFNDEDAASLAVMSIAALEGAIVLSRSTRCVRPLSQVGEQLEFLVKAREFVSRNGIPGKQDGSPNQT
ncbi:MAG TPA: TetR/AcrR family transcriptional regulator, partial [Mycobacterium sp.]|nr:TetR/AcrR family transcriptional regulator [Mycobacterium sp.]